MDPQVAEAVSAYLRDYATSSQARKAFLEFIQARPNIQLVTPIIPLEDYTTRLDLIDDIRKAMITDYPDFQFTRLQFCFLIRMSLSDLRQILQMAHIGGELVKVHLENFRQLSEFLLDPRTVSNAASSAGTEKTTERRNQPKGSCLVLDQNACIVTGAAHPHVCHILPFAWYKKKSNQIIVEGVRAAMKFYLGLPHDDGTAKLLQDLVREPGSSDCVWNMICLSPLLHDWWARGYFGLKYLGATPQADGLSMIELQFIWMPRYIKQGHDKASMFIDLMAQRDESTNISSRLTHFYGHHTESCQMGPTCQECHVTNCVSAHNVHTHRPVWSGSIFKVYRPTRDTPHFQRVIQIQWAIICAAALSGFAQDVELRLDRGEDDADAGASQQGDLSRSDILEWIDEVQEDASEYSAS